MNIAELYQYTDLNYQDFVAHLLEKYGPVIDDYYRDKSYNRFLNGEIKTPAKGKTSRTSEGLIVHHINENQYPNVSNLAFIRAYRYPFKLQKKEALVYANLIEHAWLHALIAKDTHNKFGFPGLQNYLLPSIDEYYIEGYKPQLTWQINVYNEAYLTIEEAQKFIDFVKEKLPVETDVLTDDDKFGIKFPSLIKKDIKRSISRERILKKLYKNSDQEIYKNYEEFKESKINTLRDDLLFELDKVFEDF